MRIDLWLVENGRAPSRQKAQELIAAGRVHFLAASGEKKRIDKPSTFVDDSLASRIRIESSDEPEFVSRGGQKLHGAAAQTGLEFRDRTVLDVGISTGGFSDCALQLGAKRVVGIDVGHGQLSSNLKNNSRLILFEGVNARDLAVGASRESLRDQILAANDGEKFNVLVVDVSFISLKLVLPAVLGFLAESGALLALVKPQFEVGREGIGRNGIVKDVKLFPNIETSIRETCLSLGLKVESYFDSPIFGSDGNREFFIYATVPPLERV